MEQLWTNILDLLSKIVIPDWGALVDMIPLILAGLVGIVFVWIVFKYATAGPKTRAVPPMSPRPPPGVHAPAPSFAPIFLATGTFAMFGAMVVGGFGALALGLGALSLGLLYWGREAIADFLHVEHVRTPTLPVPVHAGPPPGVHEPAPSFRPFLGAYATMIIFAGLVFGPAQDRETGDVTGWPAFLIAGIVMFAIATIGWLGDFRREYKAVEEADRGHPTHEAAPRAPKGTIALFAIITIAAGAVQFGFIPPAGAEGGGAAASPSPSPAAPVDATIVAKDIKFATPAVEVPADKPIRLGFDNQDQGVDHNVEIKDGTGATLFDGEVFKGVATRVYDVPPLKPGSYPFICKVHPTMTGTLTAGS